MKGFEIIKKENKFYIRNEFFGNMMIYGIKTLKPYVKQLGEKNLFNTGNERKVKKYDVIKTTKLT